MMSNARAIACYVGMVAVAALLVAVCYWPH
jgi:hypothetical protein